VGTLEVYMLVEEEGRMRCSRCRVLLGGGLTELARRLRDRVHPPERAKRSSNCSNQAARNQSRSLSTAHRPRPRPTTSHMQTQTTRSPAIRTRTIRSALHHEAQVLCSTRIPVNRRTNARESTFHPSTAHHTAADAYVYVGWDGAFCVWGEGEMVFVPLVHYHQHRQRRKVDWEASTSPIDILIRRCSNRLSRLRLHIRRRRSLLLVAHNPLAVLPTSIFKRIQTRSSSRRQPLVRPRVHEQRRELRRQC